MTATAERSWTTQDKTGWGEGPWNAEPDKVQWIDEATGLDCLIHRGPMGNLCGYVGVPPGHPYHGKSDEGTYDENGDYVPSEVEIEVHGGLTYANRCAETDDESTGICHVPEPGRPADVWWLGFDCGHSFDICPGLEARSRELGLPPMPRFPGGPPTTYKTVTYVRGECASLARQLAAVGR